MEYFPIIDSLSNNSQGEDPNIVIYNEWNYSDFKNKDQKNEILIGWK